MFRFDFGLGDDTTVDDEHERPPHLEPARAAEPRRCVELDLEDLVAGLPPFLSYSTVTIPITGKEGGGGGEETVWRRELYDARFQALASTGTRSDGSDGDDDELEVEGGAEKEGIKGGRRGKEGEEEGEEEDLASAFDDPSDLRPGVYEGGFKTWECSLDLVTYLASSSSPARGDVLEVGCGSAIPTAWLFQDHVRRCLAEPFSRRERTFCLQDYNVQVLRLSTFPNLFLAYVRLVSHSESASGDVEVTEALKRSFVDLLSRSGTALRLFAADWSSFGPVVDGCSHFDLVLTSETIYSPASLPSLLAVLEKGSGPSSSSWSPTRVLVSAKRVYFGVGGGEREFADLVEQRGGRCQAVWSTETTGVDRVVLGCRFETTSSA